MTIEEDNFEGSRQAFTGKSLCLCPLFDDRFLAMQRRNVMLVDFYLRDLESELLRECIDKKETPARSATFVSALSQMWILAVHGLLGRWRQMVIALRDLSTNYGSDTDGALADRNASENDWERHRQRYIADPHFQAGVRSAWEMIDPLFERIDLLRVNLAKNEISGSGQTVAPLSGCGRIDLSDGSLYWVVDWGDDAVDIVSRRNISDRLRSILPEQVSSNRADR